MSYDNPFPVEVEKDKAYFWCSCGKSKNQPFCDGSHAGSDFSPKKFIPNESKKIFFCGCKQSKNKPFCDGSHNVIKSKRNTEESYSATVLPDDKAIDIAKDESILIASTNEQ